MTLFSRLAILALLAASAFSSDPVHAQQPPPQAAWLAASVQTAAPGDPVTFTAFGFDPGSPVTFKLLSPGAVVLGAATAYGDGVAVLTVKVPVATALGNHTVSASGVNPQDRPLTVSEPLSVAVRIADVGNVALARSRSSRSEPIVPAGLAAISAAIWVFAVRKRRARKVAAHYLG